MPNIDPIIYVIAGALALIFAMIVISAILLLQRSRGDHDYDEQLADMIEGDMKPQSTNITIVTRWNTHWHKLFTSHGWLRYEHSVALAGRDVLIAGGVGALLIAILTKSILIGPVVAIVVIYVFNVVLKMKSNKEAEALNTQLPGFLFAFKANIQANLTPERALLKVIDTMPSPLYDDLVVVRDRIQANSTFKDALMALKNKTASKDLKFLCVCIIQASSSGANMEDQLNIIKNILDDRRKVTNEIQKAIKAVSPSIWVASIAIPGLFAAMLVLDENARGFWFIDPLSWISLGIVGFLWAIGIWITKKLVDNIKNL